MVRRALLYGLALLQTAAVQAVLIPADLAAGLYSIPFDANGTAIAEPILLASVSSLAARSSSSLASKRQPALPQSREKCGSGGNININDFSTAKASLQEACDYGDYYNTRTAIVFTTGSAVAYMCTYDTSSRCWRQEVEEAMQRIVNSCGYGKGGESYVEAYDKSYGGDNVGQQVCRF